MRAKEGGKETPLPWSLAVHHQSHAFRVSFYHSKNEAPEEEAGLTMYPWLASQFNYTFLTKMKIEENIKKVVSGNFFKISGFWLSLDMLVFFSSFQTPRLSLFLYIRSAICRMQTVSFFFFLVTSLLLY